MNFLTNIQKQVKQLFKKRCWRFEEYLNDYRDNRGKIWKLEEAMWALFLGFAAGSTNFRNTEKFTSRFQSWVKQKVPRTMPDTTLRFIVASVEPAEIPSMITAQIRDFMRSKYLQRRPESALRTIAIDCKYISMEKRFHPNCSENEDVNGKKHYNLGTMRAVMTSSSAKVCLQMEVMPGKTNDKGHFGSFYKNLLTRYEDDELFDLVSLDAGFASIDNCSLVHESDKYYLLALKGNQRELFKTAKSLFDQKTFENTPDFQSKSKRSKGNIIQNKIWILPFSTSKKGWDHASQIWFVKGRTEKPDGTISEFDRFFLTNLPVKTLKAHQALGIVNDHWGIENDCHWTLDTQWMEDDSVISTEGDSFETLLLFRTMAYNFNQLLKNKVFRKSRGTLIGWSELFKDVWAACSAQWQEDLPVISTA